MIKLTYSFLPRIADKEYIVADSEHLSVTPVAAFSQWLAFGTYESAPRFLEEWEKQAIIEFHLKNPLEGCRRLTFMMLDADIVAVTPSSAWRVLSQVERLSKWNGKPSKKGTGFAQPRVAHQHWHIDVSFLNIGGTFYYLCSILDGFIRCIVNWDIPRTSKSSFGS